MVQFEIKTTFPVSAQTVYEAWLDSEQHTAMTGGEAVCSDKANESFTAWDGYISGRNLALTPYSKIVQSWRTSEFGEDEEYSKVEVTLVDSDEGCELTLKHSQIPEGQSDYKTGWEDHYFTPMQVYFTKA
mgnify:CR=1 FL=1